MGDDITTYRQRIGMYASNVCKPKDKKTNIFNAHAQIIEYIRLIAVAIQQCLYSTITTFVTN
jgi:hypothetical protein